MARYGGCIAGQKKSVREIVRITSLSRNTVRKWLKASVKAEPKYRRSERPTKLSAHHEAVKLALKADAHRPKHQRRTARALYIEIQAAGYEGGYSRVTDFIRAWREGEGRPALAHRVRGIDRPWPCEMQSK